MKKALIMVVILSLGTLAITADLSIYEAISLGQLHGQMDAGSGGFFASMLFGAIGATAMNTGTVDVPANRAVFLNSLTDDRAVIAAYEQAYRASYVNTRSATTWRGFALGMTVCAIISFLISMIVYIVQL